MNNKEAIIEKIIKDANQIAEDNISKAQAECKALEDSTNQKIAEYRAKVMPKGEARAKEEFARKEMVTNLDCKKILLSKKREVVDDIFLTIADVMRKKDQKKYISLIKSMIEKNADSNDTVIICKKDEKIITAAVIEEVAKATGKKLSLSKEFGDFDGGVILSGANYDKNLSFDLEFELLKDESEGELAKILFGE